MHGRRVRSRSTNCWRSMKRSRPWFARGCRWSAGWWSPAATCGAGWAGSPWPCRSGSSRGESLPEALEGEEQSIPPLYRAVVEAGARSGRLPIALEGLAKYVRGYSEARAAIGLALWYPLLVLTLAYALFVGLVSMAVPRFVEAFDSLGLGTTAPLRWLSWVGESVPYWWPVGPVLLLVLLIAWVRSGRAARFQAGSWSWLSAFPVDEVDPGQL